MSFVVTRWLRLPFLHGCRLELLKERQKSTNEAFAKISAALTEDQTSLKKLQDDKATKQANVQEIESDISDLVQQLEELSSNHEMRSNVVEEFKRATTAKQKEVDSMGRRIAEKVTSCCSAFIFLRLMFCYLQESAIEKLNNERYSIFQRCKLEGIKLPLLEGSLGDIPSQVCSSYSASLGNF